MNAEEVQMIVRQALISERARRFKRKLKLLVLVGILTPAIIYAVSIGLPNRFNSGDLLSSAKLNDNFDTIIAKVNDLDAKISAAEGKSWRLIYENDITSAQSTFTATGFNGDVDSQYKIIVHLINGGAGANTVQLRPNNDTTAAVYANRYLLGSGAVASANGGSVLALEIAFANALGESSITECYMNAKSGRIRITNCLGSYAASGATIASAVAMNSVWNNTAANITSFTFVAGIANGFGIGTHVEIWARR
jgi:hypothetical protein